MERPQSAGLRPPAGNDEKEVTAASLLAAPEYSGYGSAFWRRPRCDRVIRGGK
jgi:hypothetical protein